MNWADQLSLVIFAAVGLGAYAASAQGLAAFDRQFLSVIVLAGYGTAFGVAPAFLFADASDRPLGTSEDVFLAACASALGLLGLLLGRGLARRLFGAPTPLARDFLRRNRTLLITTSTIIGLLGYGLVAYASAGSLGAYLAASRFEFRSVETSPLATLGVYLQPLIALPPALLIIVPRTPVDRLLGLAIGLVVAAAAFNFTKGARSFTVGLIITLAIAWLVSLPRRSTVDQRSSTGRSLAAALLVAIAVAVLLPNLYQARAVLSSDGWAAAASRTFANPLSDKEKDTSLFQQEPYNYSEYTVAAARYFPARSEYLWAYPLRRLVLFPLRSGNLKPPDTNLVFAEVTGNTGSGTTIPPSLPGEGYVVLGGLAGVAPWAALYGLALGFVESRQRRPVVTAYALTVGTASALLALRGQLYELALQAIITSLLIYTLTRVLPFRRHDEDTGDLPAGALSRS